MLMSFGKIIVEVSEKIKSHLLWLPRTRRAETRSFKLIRNFSIRWICTYAIQSVFIQILHLSINQQTASMNLSLNAFRWIVISLHFFLLLSCLTLFHQWSVLNQVPQGSASLTVNLKEQNGSLAVVPGAKQAQLGQIHKKTVMPVESKFFYYTNFSHPARPFYELFQNIRLVNL